MKVLISAYACEPGKGSEPEVGWQWASQMSRLCDVTVLTRVNNRPSIETATAGIAGEHPAPRFVYFDLGRAALRWKKRLGATMLYYSLWQRAVRRRVTELVAANRFDVLHHATFAGFRFPVGILGHAVPSVWGPIGGAESIPWVLLPWRHLASAGREATRNMANVWQMAPWSMLRRRLRLATRTLASTPEMQRILARLGCSADLMPTIGLQLSDFPKIAREPGRGPLRLLYVGNLVGLKGIDLAIQGLAASGTDATFTLVGDGDFLEPCRALAGRLGVGDRVRFLGRRPHVETLSLYREFDTLLFPSLHDTGGYAVIEAMASGLPVICLPCGGPGLAVEDGTGIRVALGSRTAVIKGLAEAIATLCRDRARLAALGNAARQTIERRYDWATKAGQMLNLYRSLSAPGSLANGNE